MPQAGRESAERSSTTGLLPLFQTTASPSTAIPAEGSEPCDLCHRDHGECPYGGCKPGEHCERLCPYGTAWTDWDRTYPHIGAIHRGVALPPTDMRGEPESTAHRILSAVGTRVLGMHWTSSEQSAREAAAKYASHPTPHHVVLHASRPDRDHIETDPHRLYNNIVYDHGADEREVPLRDGAPVHITGVSWKHAGRWIRHDFGKPIQHTARLLPLFQGPGLEHLAAKGGTSDATFAKSSMMIALVPPRSLADKLVVDNGESATDMHVTLAYLPHVEPGDTGRITGVVAEWASRHPAPVCRVQGAGTFVKSGSHVLWAAVDVKRSSHLHSTLVDALKAAGFAPSEEHGFTPHLTLSYEKHHVRFLPKIEPESFTAYMAWVCRGDDWRPVPFGGATASKIDD